MRHIHLANGVALAAVLVVAVPTARAQNSGPIVITTDTKAKRGMYPMAVPLPPTGDAALSQLVTDVQTFDLNVSSWFKEIGRASCRERV